VRDLSLAVEPGELVTLLGPSGCGKTTTLRMLAGFERPDRGTITIGDRDVTRLLANERDIGFVFQNYALFPHLSVLDNVAYGLRIKKRPAAAIARAVADVLAMVGLTGYERRRPNELSGGEQQRVALARAIVFGPRVLLCDEPLSNLDASLRIQMRDEIQALQKRLGLTTLYVTHDQEEAMAISDRIAVMDRGEIVQTGDAETLYRRPNSEFVARFIGKTNLLSGRLTASDATGSDLDIGGASLRLPGIGAGIARGEMVRVVIRPELIDLAPPADAVPAGTIVRRTFLGDRAEYQVEIGGQALRVTAYDPRQTGFKPGDRVAIGIARPGVHVL
jgi:iron(III) transport system ATP-binding protein